MCGGPPGLAFKPCKTKKDPILMSQVSGSLLQFELEGLGFTLQEANMKPEKGLFNEGSSRCSSPLQVPCWFPGVYRACHFRNIKNSTITAHMYMPMPPTLPKLTWKPPFKSQDSKPWCSALNSLLQCPPYRRGSNLDD